MIVRSTYDGPEDTAAPPLTQSDETTYPDATPAPPPPQSTGAPQPQSQSAFASDAKLKNEIAAKINLE
jgi:hypothetical protein